MDTVLSFDVGEKKIGVAIGDTVTRMAFVRPALLVQTWDEAWPMIQELVKENQVATILVGLPLNTDGTTGAQAIRVQEFITQLEERYGLPVISCDERHSTSAVQHEQQQVGRILSRGQEDSLAAQLLLESYLSETP